MRNAHTASRAGRLSLLETPLLVVLLTLTVLAEGDRLLLVVLPLSEVVYLQRS